LVSREYFLKTLDRPHYAGEDANGNPPKKRKPAEPPKQQVRNEQQPIVTADGQ